MPPDQPEDPMDPRGQDLEPQPQECHTLPSRDSTNNTTAGNPAHNITKVETRQEVEHTQHHYHKQQQQRIAEDADEKEDVLLDNNGNNSNTHRVTSASSSHHSHSRTAVRHTTSKTTTTCHGVNDHGNGGVQRVTSSPTIRNTRARLGLRPAAPINEEEQIAQWQGLRWSRVRVALREPFSEFFGVVTMVVLGNASVAQVLLSTGQREAPGGGGYGGYQSINWGWGIGVMLGLYVAGDSGAYLNPAITFSNCLFRQLPWRRFPSYAVAQLLGAFVGSGIVYANYVNAIDHYEGKGIRTVPPSEKATASIFCTFPQPFLSRSGQFFSEFIASAILVLVVFALRDPGNNGIEKDGKWFPLMMMFLIFALGSGLGWETGNAINPARDLGPRIMATLLGYGSEMWTAGGYYFWIPIVAPFCGCVFGGLLYDVFIYTGASPINTPWMGLKHIFRPDYGWRVARERYRKGIEEGLV